MKLWWRAWLLVVVLLGTDLLAAQEPATLEWSQVEAPNDRVHSQHFEQVVVRTAVPSAEETLEIFGVDLYAQNVQPVWIEIENTGDVPLLFTPRGVDEGYYTAFETGNRLPGGIARWLNRGDAVLYQNYWPQLVIAPRSRRSGYVYSRVDEGTKSFNVDVVGGGQPYLMSFFIPVPGLRLDHYEVKFSEIYPEQDWRDVDLDGLRDYLESLPCCVTGKDGGDHGDPLNIAFIGDVEDLYYTFMRAGWDETETIHGAALWKMAKSTLSGGEYRYSPVSALYVFGRPQDVALQKARTSIDERNHMRLWLTPVRHEGLPLWIGQISRDIGVHFTKKTITTHKIDPDVDETRDFLAEDLAYAQGLQRLAYVQGVGPASYDQPRGNLTGDPYFTDGQRLLMWISRSPVAFDKISIIKLGQTNQSAGAVTNEQ
ncbi:MAG TPA: LssY C-terminal domain-containing protein [Xanthomonadales bacterium]|nr:LssY C-terminal domain-containing protein [Xanthomonadales bacterium]